MLQGPTRDVSLSRAPAGMIGDRVRLFELFAAQKERAVDDDRSRVFFALSSYSSIFFWIFNQDLQVQCQAWLDTILRDLLEAKRVLDEQVVLVVSCFFSSSTCTHTWNFRNRMEGSRISSL